MFCRLVEDEAMPYHATAIHRWMQEELQIKAAMRACIKDLRRERDKVCTMYFRGARFQKFLSARGEPERF